MLLILNKTGRLNFAQHFPTGFRINMKVGKNIQTALNICKSILTLKNPIYMSANAKHSKYMMLKSM
jgi:hypothetical protein